MKKKLVTYLNGFVVGSFLLGACSHPVATFQRGTVAQYYTPNSAAPTAGQAQTPDPTANTAEPVATVVAASEPTPPSATKAVDQLEAYVRNDAKLASNKQLGKRMDRIRNLMADAANSRQHASVTAQHKTTLLERVMLKKMDRKISKHLAPEQPNKPMINGGLLGGSLVLVLAGVLLLLLTTGTAATIGLIAAVIGAIGLIFGLLAS